MQTKATANLIGIYSTFFIKNNMDWLDYKR